MLSGFAQSLIESNKQLNMLTHILMIDTLEKQALYSLQDSLQSIGSLMALQTRQLPMIQLGLCGVIRATPKDVKLQVYY